jgi:hypothetical protein
MQGKTLAALRMRKVLRWRALRLYSIRHVLPGFLLGLDSSIVSV